MSDLTYSINFCSEDFSPQIRAGAAYPTGLLVVHRGNPQDCANSLQTFNYLHRSTYPLLIF